MRIKIEVGLELKRRPSGFWTPERTLEEVRKFYEEYGEISQQVFAKNQRLDLCGAVAKYPGGMVALRKDLGLKVIKKPDGYWTEKRIEEEAWAFYLEYGRLTPMLLTENYRQDLIGAIATKYPGRFIGLQEKLGIRHQNHGKNVLEAYAKALSDGHMVTFEEFVRQE